MGRRALALNLTKHILNTTSSEDIPETSQQRDTHA